MARAYAERHGNMISSEHLVVCVCVRLSCSRMMSPPAGCRASPLVCRAPSELQEEKPGEEQQPKHLRGKRNTPFIKKRLNSYISPSRARALPR